ncbi:DUF5706 domain-containing protein [Enterococcus hirae]|uniref:Pycsar system effector family protein n=1 Tax=Enterococcus hirae TaxID=1354 RepID=UPI0039192571
MTNNHNEKVFKKINSKKIEKQDILDRLDRILEWIRACDTKASILLATMGIIMTVFSTEFFLTKLKSILKYNLNEIDFSKILYLIFVVVFFGLFLVGIFFLVLELNPALISKKNNNENIESTYYFEAIAKKELSTLKEEIKQLAYEKEIDDIITQLHINSKICTKKYRYTKIGIFCSLTGTFGILLLFIVGWIILIAN